MLLHSSATIHASALYERSRLMADAKSYIIPCRKNLSPQKRMQRPSTCPIWGTSATAVSVVSNRGDTPKEAFDSERTGGWYIANRLDMEGELQDCDDRVRARLTTWLIDQRRLGEEMPEIDTAVIKEVKRQKDLSVPERADRLLRAAKQTVSDIGKLVELEGYSYFWLAHSESVNGGEVRYLGEYLKHRGWLLHPREYQHAMVFQISVEGYAHLAELDAVNSESDQAFVAMWFDKAMSSAWKEGIEPAIEEAGYIPRRIDRKEFTDKIDDEAVAEIRRSRFLVADFTHGETGTRGSVYYEAGFAHGLNITVIFSCQKDYLDRIHFDLRQYNCIEWERPEDLKDRLVKRICATVGDGPHKA